MNFNVINVLKYRQLKTSFSFKNIGLLSRKRLHLSADCLKECCGAHKLDNFENCSAKIDEKPKTAKSEVNLSETRLDFQKKLLNGPHLRDFFTNDLFERESPPTESSASSYPVPIDAPPTDSELAPMKPRKVYFDVYGCQMNVNDTEIVYAILAKNNFERTMNHAEADVILIMTCAIRDSAEERIWGRLKYFKGLRRGRPGLKVGVLGCMAERLKERVLEKEQTVDVVAGPDAYRDLPRLLAMTTPTQKSVNVQLSLEETYADIAPVRLNSDAISAYVSIMRGCDNMCTYCIVPFTRGRERSRPLDSIVREVQQLWEAGVREVTLLGQNVNSYNYLGDRAAGDVGTTVTASGFKTVYKPKKSGTRFAQLLEQVARGCPEMRVRFTSPHPKDFPDDVLEVIASHANICKCLHMPAQSGSSAVLERMRRGYTREAYLALVDRIRHLLPDVALTSDFICGFCGETEEEFAETLTLMEAVRFNFAYLFAYSMRERTTAHRRFKDDVPAVVKQQRLEQMINLFRAHALQRNKSQVGRTHLVLVEGVSKKDGRFLQGRNDHNTRVILPAGDLHFRELNDCNNLMVNNVNNLNLSNNVYNSNVNNVGISNIVNYSNVNNIDISNANIVNESNNVNNINVSSNVNNVGGANANPGVSNIDIGGARPIQKGDYVAVYINDANSQTLKGIPLYLTTLQDFYKQQPPSYVNANSDDKYTAQI